MVYTELDIPGGVGDYIEIIRHAGIHAFLMQLDMTAHRFPRGDAKFGVPDLSPCLIPTGKSVSRHVQLH